jgi:hypothetical protein
MILRVSIRLWGYSSSEWNILTTFMLSLTRILPPLEKSRDQALHFINSNSSILPQDGGH